LEQRIRDVLAEALHSGLPHEEVKGMVMNQLAALEGKVPTIASVPQVNGV
jgi:hypothetical protein